MSKITRWLLLFCLSASLDAQNLYDYAHSRAYARHLLQTRQYGLAAEEYERLVFMQPQNDTLRVELLRAYRRGKNPQQGLACWEKWQREPIPARRTHLLESERVKLLLCAGQPAEARAVATTLVATDSAEWRRTRLFSFVLEQNWRDARASLQDFPSTEKIPQRSETENLIRRGERAKTKKPWAAAALSIPLPGLGKAYAGQWKDGAMSLLFVGLNGWLAQRRFQKEGADTFWGWVHGGFALGFYIGNIYGAHKAARQHNRQTRSRLQHDAEALLFPLLD